MHARIMHAGAMDIQEPRTDTAHVLASPCKSQVYPSMQSKEPRAMQGPRAKEQEPKTKSQRPRVRKEKDRRGKSADGEVGRAEMGGRVNVMLCSLISKPCEKCQKAGCSKLSVTWSQKTSSSLALSHGRSSHDSSDLFDNGAPLPPTWDKRCCMSSPTMLDKTMVVPRATQLC